mgnify:CR=1 FL=1
MNFDQTTRSYCHSLLSYCQNSLSLGQNFQGRFWIASRLCHSPVDFRTHSCSLPHARADARISKREWQKPVILISPVETWDDGVRKIQWCANVRMMCELPSTPCCLLTLQWSPSSFFYLSLPMYFTLLNLFQNPLALTRLLSEALVLALALQTSTRASLRNLRLRLGPTPYDLFNRFYYIFRPTCPVRT